MHSPIDVRTMCRSGEYDGPTAGYAPGYAQANLCILPKEYAFDFFLFCQRNPQPCPLLHVLEEGEYSLDSIDVRYDLPKYRIFENGALIKEVPDLCDVWREDFITFVIGCSFSFEEALIKSGLHVRHLDESVNVPMYQTNIPCKKAGVFSSNMVVSMRPFKPEDAIKATTITSRFSRVHGSPVHIGDPQAIGILDINKPDYGDAVSIREGELPVFWACGVTPQAAVMRSKPSICITHAPGHMLVLNETNESLALK